MEYFIGQVFENDYPPAAAVWCMVNNAHIELVNGKYTIVENIKPQIDISDLIEFVYQEKCKIAYGGITLIKLNEKYLFETKNDSINMASGKAISITDKPDDFEITWKTWKDDIPVILRLTKKEFIDIFNFSMLMIDLAFALEGKLNLLIQSFTEKQLADEQFLTKFKENVITEFSKINTTYLLNNRE